MATFASVELGRERKTRICTDPTPTYTPSLALRRHPYGPFGQDDRIHCQDVPVQRPLARQRVVLSHRVVAYYGRIRVSQELPPIYLYSYSGSSPFSLIQGCP